MFFDPKQARVIILNHGKGERLTSLETKSTTVMTCLDQPQLCTHALFFTVYQYLFAHLLTGVLYTHALDREWHNIDGAVSSACLQTELSNRHVCVCPCVYVCICVCV